MAGVVPYLPASFWDYGRERGRHHTRPSHMHTVPGRTVLGGRNGQQARGGWPGGQIAVATRQKSTARRFVSAMPERRAQVRLGTIALDKIALDMRAGTLPMLCGTAVAVTI
jgi:hypothetical protein